MPSILSRLRTRAVSQTSHHSAQSAPTTATTVTTPTHDEQETQPPVQVQGSAPATRRIFQDLDLLTNELATEQSSISRGLSPPVRRGPHTSSNPSTPILGPTEPSALPSVLTANVESDSPKPSQTSHSSSNSAPTGQRGFMERLGDWSTFGRRRAPPPSLNEFGMAVQISPSPSAWRAARRANSRLSSRPSSKSNRTTASTHSSPQLHDNNNNNTPRPSYQSSSDRLGHKRISTFGGRELVHDSSPAHTLENLSPEVSPRIVPPMPALVRPLGTTATYPPDARRESKDITRRFTFGKTLRPYRSLPRVQHIFKTKEEENKGELSRAGDDDGENKGQGSAPIPTVGSTKLPSDAHPISSPYTATSSSSPPSSASSSSKSAPAVGPRAPHDPIPVASNLYDPHMSIIGNVVPMQQDVPRVQDRKPLRSSLKSSARPPIASSSSSNAGASVHMPSLSLVAATGTSPDGAVPQTPVSSPGRSETAKGKRKADDVDTTPPDPKKATFAVPGVHHVFFYSYCIITSCQRASCKLLQLPRANTRPRTHPPLRPHRTTTNARVSQVHRLRPRPQTHTTQAHFPPAPPPASHAHLPLRVQRPQVAAAAQEQDHQNPRQSASGGAQSRSAQYRSARSSRHMRLPSAAHPPHTTCVIRGGHHGAWRLGGLCVFVRLKKRGRLYMRGCFISPSCSFRCGGSPLYGACRRRGSSAGRTRRRRCHWMTHRSSLVRYALFMCVGCRSTTVGQMRALGASVVALWRLSRWSLTFPLLSASPSSHEMTPTLHLHRYSSPRLGLGDCEFFHIFSYYFHIIFFFLLPYPRFYVCTCFLVLLSLPYCQSFDPKRHSFIYIVKYPPHSGLFTQGTSSIHHMLCKSHLA